MSPRATLTRLLLLKYLPCCAAFHAERGTSFVVVTHDPRLAARCDRLVELIDGRIARDEAITEGCGASTARVICAVDLLLI